MASSSSMGSRFVAGPTSLARLVRAHSAVGRILLSTAPESLGSCACRCGAPGSRRGDPDQPAVRNRFRTTRTPVQRRVPRGRRDRESVCRPRRADPGRSRWCSPGPQHRDRESAVASHESRGGVDAAGNERAPPPIGWAPIGSSAYLLAFKRVEIRSLRGKLDENQRSAAAMREALPILEGASANDSTDQP